MNKNEIIRIIENNGEYSKEQAIAIFDFLEAVKPVESIFSVKYEIDDYKGIASGGYGDSHRSRFVAKKKNYYINVKNISKDLILIFLGFLPYSSILLVPYELSESIHENIVKLSDEEKEMYIIVKELTNNGTKEINRNALLKQYKINMNYTKKERYEKFRSVIDGLVDKKLIINKSTNITISK